MSCNVAKVDSKALNLLEPGALLAGALFRSLGTVAVVERFAPGTRFGPFRIVDELGRGGMGVVYRAERDDGEYQQQVAIKCANTAASLHGTEWFRRERQILAELKHPNIARLLDGGQDQDGRLWLAMEVVDGQPIDAHARAQRLDVDARLHLFLQLISAVEAAHARLLIHRDIKPSNVLVDADGRAKLLDFGIAALATDANAARAYSPGWASPEQCAGEYVGPASDQYQLGVLLNAVLRTTPERDASKPQATAQPEQIEPFVRAVDARQWPPMTAARRSELLAIVRKATAPIPSARYGSVSELGTDLRRWLELRPVSARGGGLVYTFACAWRRHPWVASGIATVLMLGIALAVVFNWRLTQQRDIAQAERQRANHEAADARAITQFLNEDLLSAADPYGQNAKDVKIGELVERAVPRVAERFHDQPDVAGELYRTLGNVLMNLGRIVPARAALDQAILALSKAYGADAPVAVEARLLRAEAEEYAGGFDENARLLNLLSVDLGGLDARDPRRIKVDYYLAWSDYIGGRFASTDASLRKLLERSAGNPGVSALERAKMQGIRSLALSRMNRDAEALDLAELAYGIRVGELGPDHPETLQSMVVLATALAGVERLDTAQATFEDAYQRARTRFGSLHYETTIIAHELGVVLMRAARPALAIPYLEAAVAAKIAANGVQSGSTVNSISWLGLAYLRADHMNGAERSFARVSGFVATSEFDQRVDISLHRNIGELRLAQGRAVDALASCDYSAQVAQPLLAASHPLRLSVEACRGIAMIGMGRKRDGRKLLLSLHMALRAAGSQDAWWAAKVDAAIATVRR